MPSSDIEWVERPSSDRYKGKAVIDLLSSPLPASSKPSKRRTREDDDDELPSLASVWPTTGQLKPNRSVSSHRPSMTPSEDPKGRTEPVIPSGPAAGPSTLKRGNTTSAIPPPKRAAIVVEDDMELEDVVPGMMDNDLGEYQAGAGLDDGWTATPNRSASKSTTTATRGKRKGTMTPEEKARKKELAAQAKEVKKAAADAEKQVKKTYAAANRLTHNRKETAVEVHLTVPHVLLSRHPVTSKDGFAKVWLALETRFETAKEQDGCSVNAPSLVGPEPLPAHLGGKQRAWRDGDEVDAISWVRDATKEWDDERRIYVPFDGGQTRQVEEGTVCLYWTGKDVDTWVGEMAADDGRLSGCMARVRQAKRQHPGKQIFVIVQGLQALFRAERSAVTAATTAAIRAQLPSSTTEPSAPSSRSTATTATVKPTVGRDVIERELERVRIVTGARTVMTEDRESTADWLLEMTLEIGVRPYKTHKHELQDAYHLTGQEPKGKDLQDTYIKFLSAISRVTDSEAAGIVAWYPTLRSLFEGWERAVAEGGEARAREMLVGAAKGRKLDGSSTGRKMGRDGSKKVYEVLFARRAGHEFAYA